ncbi:hypothetical protein [Halosimplex sp. J119]
MRHGLTGEPGQYLYARLFRQEDRLPVTEQANAAQYAEAVDNLSDGEFAVFTNLRTATAAPAYFWAADTEWKDGRLVITVERRTNSYDGTGDEVVGVALTKFESDGPAPTGADVVFPSGATIQVGETE